MDSYINNKNRYYERRIRAGIKAGGNPILAIRRVKIRALLRHLRDGGIIFILLDKKYSEGVRIPFLGHNALISLSAAQLALKYDLPTIPALVFALMTGTHFTLISKPQSHTPTALLWPMLLRTACLSGSLQIQNSGTGCWSVRTVRDHSIKQL